MAGVKFPTVILLYAFAFIFGLFTLLNVSNVAVGFRIKSQKEELKNTWQRGAAVMTLLFTTILLVMLAHYLGYQNQK